MATAELTSKPVKLSTVQAEIAPQTPLQRVVRRFVKHKAAMFGLVIVIFVVLYVVIGSFVFSETFANRNETSDQLLAPTQAHPFGTDRIGRDIMARTVYGGQISLIIGILAGAMEVTLGMAIGAVAGYYGGWVDAILMRFTEAMLSIPQLLLLLVMAKFFGNKIPDIPLFGREFSGSVVVIIVILGVTSWMGLARIIRSNVLSLKETEFILAARALGLPNWRIIWAHLLPNTMASAIVALTLGVGGAILSEAYVSFLGLGVQPPTASWGNMLTEAQDFHIIANAPWYWLFPSLLILLTVLGINFVGDGLRDALDPRSDKKV